VKVSPTSAVAGQGAEELPPAAPFPGFREGESVTLPAGLLGVFHPGDERLRWRLDFHYPRGIVPLGHELLGGVNRASQEAAEALPVATGRGLVGRLVGPHLYTAGIPVDEHRVAGRAAAASAEIASYPDRFLDEWTTGAAVLGAAHRDLDGRIRATDDVRTLGTLFHRANTVFAQAWRLHFDVMYRLLAVTASFRTVCAAVGVPPDEVSRLLPSGDTTVQRTDRRLWRLSRAATEAGLTDVFREHTGAGLLAAVRTHPQATAWFAAFEEFVDRFGSRSDQVADVGTPSWLEAPERPLELVRQMVLDGGDPTRAAEAQSRRRADRLEELRTRMSPRNRGAFDRSYAWCRRGNFTWWNEEHNTHIDLRAHLPVRAIGRAVAAASGARPDDGVLLYAGEVRALCDGDIGWTDVSGLVVERAEHLAVWRQRRAALPRAVGTASAQIDPLMAEIIGGDTGAPAPSGPELLHGVPASAGIARGPVRRVSDVGQLDRLAPGDVLVCEATSPSWTPVFPRLAACLCDSGGPLTHAAIVCREYGVPCVCALGVAMQTLQDGDLVEVDGRAGTVTVLRRA